MILIKHSSYIFFFQIQTNRSDYPLRLLNKTSRAQRAGTPSGGGGNLSTLAVNQGPTHVNSRSSSKLDEGGGSISSKNSSGSFLQHKTRYGNEPRNNSDGNLSTSSSLRDVQLGNPIVFQHSQSVDRATNPVQTASSAKVKINLSNFLCQLETIPQRNLKNIEFLSILNIGQ